MTALYQITGVDPLDRTVVVLIVADAISDAKRKAQDDGVRFVVAKEVGPEAIASAARVEPWGSLERSLASSI